MQSGQMKHWLGWVTLLGGTVALNVPAYAQDSGGRGLEEVVVTARNRSELLQEVPIPISVVSGETLGRDRTFTVAELSQRAPGLTATTPNARRTGVSIRGIGKTSGNDNMEPAVGVIIDDVFLGHVGMTYQDFTDLERVEILRGPQGTLARQEHVAGCDQIHQPRPFIYAARQPGVGRWREPRVLQGPRLVLQCTGRGSARVPCLGVCRQAGR